MSRRKTAPQYVVKDVFRVDVGCTGRGSHPQVRLGKFSVFGELDQNATLEEATNNPDNFFGADGDYQYVSAIQAPEQYVEFDYLDAKKSVRTYPFKCSRCGRNVPMSWYRLWRVLRLCKSKNLKMLDLSALDVIS